jgi:hypothetical protein
MAANDYGTAHLYGITGTIANATVLSFKEDGTCANVDSTMDENGKVVERRYDDKTYDAVVTIRIRSAYTVPVQGDTFTYDGNTYEIEKVGRSQEQRGFRTVELGMKRSEGITYS